MDTEIFIVNEVSSYEGQLAALQVLKKQVQEAKAELSDSYRGIINAKAEFEKIKKQNIEEIRLYKFSIKAECVEIKSSIDAINKLVVGVAACDLKDFADTCERLAALERSGFFAKIKIAT